MDKDITDQVEFGDPDGESLPLTQCACGRKFYPWDFVLTCYPDMAHECNCGRKLYFRNEVTVYEAL